MTCYANRHTFHWGSSTAADAMPLSLRCECGVMSQEGIDPFRQLQARLAAIEAENATLRERLHEYHNIEAARLGFAAETRPDCRMCAALPSEPSSGEEE